jgi:hypothetical protein
LCYYKLHAFVRNLGVKENELQIVHDSDIKVGNVEPFRAFYGKWGLDESELTVDFANA